MSLVEPKPRALRADAERNRRRILDAARATFAEHGLDVGVDAIARAAGVGTGTVYRRFPTKEQLLRAILEDRVDALVEQLEEIARIDDPWDAFAAAAERFASAIAHDRAFFQLFQQTNQPLVGEASKLRMLEALAPILHRAQAAGVVRDDVVIVDVPALCAVAARLPVWRLARQPELWRRYLAVVLDGLRPAGAHALPHPPPLPLPRDDGEASATGT
jgi:AcrR family transcriptional regulator